MAKPFTISSLPRLRPLEAFPYRKGDDVVQMALRDPERIAQDVLLASPAMAVLLPLLDGTRDGAAIAAAWKAETGGDLASEDLAAVLNDLDKCLLLEGERVEAARKKLLARYRAQARRPAAHAGESYPEDPGACATQLQLHMMTADVGLTIEGSEANDSPDVVAAVLAPHIDLRGGGPCHGAAAKAISRSPAEVFVVLGTAHAPMRRPFALTTLDFDTPLGPLPTDRDLVARLAARGGGGLLDAELAHEMEHSVEFQALWIRHVHAARKDVRIVPVLVGSIHERIRDGRSPMTDPAMRDFVEALRELKAEYGSRMAFVASVDFSHVGPRYGHPKAPDAETMGFVRDSDEILMVRAWKADAEGWFRFLHEDGDRWNVCGAAPTYAFLAAIAGTVTAGTTLRHDEWEIDPETGSHVSFAAIAYGPK